MANKYLLLTLVMGLTTMFVSCINDDTQNQSTPNSDKIENELTVEDAKTFFKSFQMNSFETRSDVNSPENLMPGNFTPKWEQARPSHNTNISNVDIPILSQYRYKATRSELYNGKSNAYSVNITQKLVISKSLKTNELSCYIITLMPDAICYNENKQDIDEQFISHGEKKNYSGWVFYSLPQVKIPIAAQYYKEGKKEMHFVLPQTNGKYSIGAQIFKKFINGIKFSISQFIQTRSFGEDDSYDNFQDWFETEIWPDAENGDSYTMNQDDESGQWYLKDNDGNRYNIPDDVGEEWPGKDKNNDDLYNQHDWGGGAEGGIESGEDCIMIKLYHRECGTYLGTILLDEWENGIYWCPTCKKYITIVIG